MPTRVTESAYWKGGCPHFSEVQVAEEVKAEDLFYAGILVTITKDVFQNLHHLSADTLMQLIESTRYIISMPYRGFIIILSSNISILFYV